MADCTKTKGNWFQFCFVIWSGSVCQALRLSQADILTKRWTQPTPPMEIIIFWHEICRWKSGGVAPSHPNWSDNRIWGRKILLLRQQVTAWSIVERRWAYQRSYCTSGPVSTGMGDRLWTGKPRRYATDHPGQHSLLPYAGGSEYRPKCGDTLRLGSKGRMARTICG